MACLDEPLFALDIARLETDLGGLERGPFVELGLGTLSPPVDSVDHSPERVTLHHAAPAVTTHDDKPVLDEDIWHVVDCVVAVETGPHPAGPRALELRE